MPHEDGDAYAPVVATVSLGGSVVLEISERGESRDGGSEAAPSDGGHDRDDDDDDGGKAESRPSACESVPNGSVHKDGTGHGRHSKRRKVSRVLLEPRSLFVTTGDAYTTLLHGIPPLTIDEDLCMETVANWHLLGDVDEFLKSGGGGDEEGGDDGIEEDGAACGSDTGDAEGNLANEVGVRVRGEREGGGGARQHRIDNDVNNDSNRGRNIRKTRISLTFRDVLKVKTMHIGVGGGRGGGVFGKKMGGGRR